VLDLIGYSRNLERLWIQRVDQKFEFQIEHNLNITRITAQNINDKSNDI